MCEESDCSQRNWILYFFYLPLKQFKRQLKSQLKRSAVWLPHHSTPSWTNMSSSCSLRCNCNQYGLSRYYTWAGPSQQYKKFNEAIHGLLVLSTATVYQDRKKETSHTGCATLQSQHRSCGRCNNIHRDTKMKNIIPQQNTRRHQGPYV
jgi:hypothetical protein